MSSDERDDPSRGAPGVPPLLVEKLARGELPAQQAAEVRRRLDEGEGAGAALARLKRSDDEILEAYPAEREVAAIRAAARERDAEARAFSTSARRFFLAAPALAAACAVVLFVVARGPADTSAAGPNPYETTREKGLAPHLVVFRSEGNSAVRLEPGDDARAGDVLQLSYVAAGARYGVIVSVDGNGSVTRHLPSAGTVAARLEPAGAVALPQAYELDAAPAFERFVLVTGDAPFDASLVLDAARKVARDPARAKDAPLALFGGLSQASFVVEKR